MSGDYVERLRAWLDAHGVIAGDPLEIDLRAVLEELERLRAVHSCGSSIPTESGRKVCVLAFGHDDPKHRDADGVWWEIHIGPATPDDAAVALIRQQALAAPNWYAAPQRSEPGGAL